jgi:hypothetical protein
MKPIRMIQTHLPRIAAPALVVLLTACTLEIVQTSATEAVTFGGSPAAASAAETVAAAAPAENVPAPTATQPPAGDGWLLVKTESGLWMSRPDGGESGIRIPGPISIPVPISAALSPSGGLLAYITFVFGGQGYANPVLNIVSPTGRRPAVVIPLTSPATARTDNLPNDIHVAISEISPLAWSPDGGRLAFIGAQEGQSADLYEYYRESGRVVRLSDGPDQAYRPLWSPDGAWIVHGAAVGFGSGAGYGVTGIYAARADGGGIISLYDIGERSGDEVGAGWLDDHTLVAHTWYAACGPKNLRLADLSAQKADLVFEGCLSDVAVGPGVVLFAQSPDTAVFDENPRPGMYLLTASDRTPRLIGGENIYQLAWEKDLGAFLALTKDNRLLEISPAGDIRALPAMASRMPAVSPNGRWWAYIHLAERVFSNTDGIFVGEYGMDLRQIFDGAIAPGGMIFSPAGDALYFVTATGNLYRAQAPDWNPALLASGLTPAYGWSDMAWWEG